MQITLKKANHIFLIFLILFIFVGFLDIDAALTTFIDAYFSLLLIILLLSLSFLIYEIILSIREKRKIMLDLKQDHQVLIHKLTQLSYEEKNILALFVNDKVQEKSLNPHDQAVAWLQNIKFIHFTGKLDRHKHVFRIEPSLTQYLSQNPNSLY